MQPCHTDPILFVRESLLDALVELAESLAQGYGAVGGRPGDGVHQLAEVGLEVHGALLDHVGLCLCPVEPGTPAHGHRYKVRAERHPSHRPGLAHVGARHLAQESNAKATWPGCLAQNTHCQSVHEFNRPICC